MLRRLTLGVLASLLLTLASVAVAGAQATPSPSAPGTGAPAPASADGQGPTGPGVPMGGMVILPSRTHHPGDLVYSAPCNDCHVILDPCEFLAICQQLPGGIPFPPVLHWTTLRPNVPQFFPHGPYVCAPPVGRNVPLCVEALTAGIGFPGGEQFTPPGGQTPGAQPGQPAAPGAPGAPPTGPGGQQSQPPAGPQTQPPAPAPGGPGEPTAPPR